MKNKNRKHNRRKRQTPKENLMTHSNCPAHQPLRRLRQPETRPQIHQQRRNDKPKT